MAYSRDTEVSLTGTFTDEVLGALADPDEVTLEVLNPAGAKTSYTLGAGEVERVSVGLFKRAQVLDQSGTWYYRFKGTGAVKVADWKAITVTDDPLG